MMTVLQNDDRWDASNVEYRDSRVVAYAKGTTTAAMRWIDYGLGGLERDLLDVLPEETDLSALQTQLANEGRLFGYEVSERFYEIGSPAALAETEAFLRSTR
jgi:NDP-sugar pyrophosphorylase family protein